MKTKFYTNTQESKRLLALGANPCHAEWVLIKGKPHTTDKEAKYNDEYPSIETFNDDYHDHAQKGMVPGLGSYNPYDGIPTDTYVDEFDKDRESWKRLNRKPDALQRDMDGYFSGKSKYVKGKGWQ